MKQRPFFTLTARRCIAVLTLFIMGYGCATTGTYLSPDELHKRLPPRIAQEIESRGVHVTFPTDLENVYYLARVDTSAGEVYVGYFLEWRGEFPDFGRVYPVSRTERRKQLGLPLVYTNWLYIPRSGGMQRLKYGPGDVEGIAVVYLLEAGVLGAPLAVRFEMPGHKAISIPDSANVWSLSQVTNLGAPSLQLASWNHMFKPPDPEMSPQRFPVHPFPGEQWDRLNMNRRRAEIAKRRLSGLADVP